MIMPRRNVPIPMLLFVILLVGVTVALVLAPVSPTLTVRFHLPTLAIERWQYSKVSLVYGPIARISTALTCDDPNFMQSQGSRWLGIEVVHMNRIISYGTWFLTSIAKAETECQMVASYWPMLETAESDYLVLFDLYVNNTLVTSHTVNIYPIT